MMFASLFKSLLWKCYAIYTSISCKFIAFAIWFIKLNLIPENFMLFINTFIINYEKKKKFSEI